VLQGIRHGCRLLPRTHDGRLGVVQPGCNPDRYLERMLTRCAERGRCTDPAGVLRKLVRIDSETRAEVIFDPVLADPKHRANLRAKGSVEHIKLNRVFPFPLELTRVRSLAGSTSCSNQTSAEPQDQL
jgi:hypothetical protein